jgi:hypothetical protein
MHGAALYPLVHLHMLDPLSGYRPVHRLCSKVESSIAGNFEVVDELQTENLSMQRVVVQ